MDAREFKIEEQVLDKKNPVKKNLELLNEMQKLVLIGAE